MLIRANTLSHGHSGIRPATLQLLLDMLNQGVHPCIPEKGSLGASGDLAPLAHMALVLIGEGEAIYQDEILPGKEALSRAGLSPVILAAKEGLALTNGTSVMCAQGVLAVKKAEMLSRIADGTISNNAGKQVFDALWKGEGEVDALIEAKGLSYELGNVVKYVSRAKFKGKYLEDLKKAKVYLDWLIEAAAENQ